MRKVRASNAVLIAAPDVGESGRLSTAACDGNLRNPGLVPHAGPARRAALLSVLCRTPHPFVQAMRALSRANAESIKAKCLALLTERGEADPQAVLTEMVDAKRGRQQLLMRRSARGLLGLLLDGRIKTAYEMPHKRDGNYLGYREETERAIGTFDHRPCYGYVAFDDQTKAAPTEFGDMVLHLRPERYSERVTCCEFDSFDQATQENFEANVFLWEDVAHLLVFQQLTGVFEDMPFAYDEVQLFAPKGRPLEAVTLADVSRVEIPEGAANDLLAEEVRKRAPWIEVQRYTLGRELEQSVPVGPLTATGDKPEIGYTIQNSPGAGWYRDDQGQTFLVKHGPEHQRQAELFGSRLWTVLGLPAAEVRSTKDGTAVAVKKLEAKEVTSSWRTPEENGTALARLVTDLPAAREQLLAAFVLDLVTGNLDGPQSIMRTEEGPLFIDFGGVALSRPRGEVKPDRHLPPTVELLPFLDRIREAVTDQHPIFDATPQEMAEITRSLIDRGLMVEIAQAAEWAGISETSAWPRTRLIHRLQTRAMSLLEPKSWTSGLAG